MAGLNIINKIGKGLANTTKNSINSDINKMKQRIKTNVKNDKNTKFENELNLQKYISQLLLKNILSPHKTAYLYLLE